MKVIKFILTFLWMFIYRTSPFYVINRIYYPDLRYIEYFLYRKVYILYFIPILIKIDYVDSLDNPHTNTLSSWYAKYGQYLNNQYTIKEIEYNKKSL